MGLSSKDTPTSPVSPDDFSLVQTLPSICLLARNRDFDLIWCNQNYADECGTPIDEMLGQKMQDVLEPHRAEERAAHMATIWTSPDPVEYVQLWNGRRWLTRVWPLKEEAFDTSGYFVLICPLTAQSDSDMVTTGDFDWLESLTDRELEVFYQLAVGHSLGEAARLLHRSVKTIDNHATSMYKKLGITKRVELVRLAAEHGLLGFKQEDWDKLIQARRA